MNELEINNKPNESCEKMETYEINKDKNKTTMVTYNLNHCKLPDNKQGKQDAVYTTEEMTTETLIKQR